MQSLHFDDPDDFLCFELYGNDCSSSMDEYLFLQEDLDIQKFQLDSNEIIEDFLSGITPFDQEYDMLIIEDFFGDLKKLSY